MSVIVKGMEMPKDCSDCDLCYDMFACSASRDVELDYEEMHKKRHDDCPLIPLPSEHGELIDRDALIDQIANPHEQAEVSRWASKMPTIIEAEGSTT